MAMIDTNPFAVLTFLAAPAVLTNASSVLALGTENRRGRAADRARAMSSLVLSATEAVDPRTQRHLANFDTAVRRARLLVEALRMFYLAVGSFAMGTCASLFGGAAGYLGLQNVLQVAVGVGGAAAVVGIAGLGIGSLRLVAETRLALRSISAEVAAVKEWRARRIEPAGIPPI
jgi:hypothetical protein